MYPGPVLGAAAVRGVVVRPMLIPVAKRVEGGVQVRDIDRITAAVVEIEDRALRREIVRDAHIDNGRLGRAVAGLDVVGQVAVHGAVEYAKVSAGVRPVEGRADAGCVQVQAHRVVPGACAIG